jgi:hypothetical protein
MSYSWDNEAHQAWVRQLASRLVQNGVEARLDQWHTGPGDSLTQFMESEIATADHVVVVCTPNYADRSVKRTGGVGYEQQIISGHIASGVPRRRFIPVVRLGDFAPGTNGAIPPHFAGIFAINMRTPEEEEAGVEALLRAIFDQPRYKAPELGHAPAFGPSKDAIRLADPEIEGWRLESGVVRNQVSPDTFQLPTEVERRSVVDGALVKLMFELYFIDDDDDEEMSFSSERMWVKVTGRSGPYYTGELRNTPSIFWVNEQPDGTFETAEDAYLKAGDPVVFLPEHIIDILEPEEGPDES